MAGRELYWALQVDQAEGGTSIQRCRVETGKVAITIDHNDSRLDWIYHLSDIHNQRYRHGDVP